MTSSSAITPVSFAGGQPLPDPPQPQAAGTLQSYTLPTHQRYVAIRAIDDAGNVGWPASIDTGVENGP